MCVWDALKHDLCIFFTKPFPLPVVFDWLIGCLNVKLITIARIDRHKMKSTRVAARSNNSNTSFAIWAQIIHFDLRIHTTSRSAISPGFISLFEFRECKMVKPELKGDKPKLLPSESSDDSNMDVDEKFVMSKDIEDGEVIVTFDETRGRKGPRICVFVGLFVFVLVVGFLAVYLIGRTHG